MSLLLIRKRFINAINQTQLAEVFDRTTIKVAS